MATEQQMARWLMGGRYAAGGRYPRRAVREYIREGVPPILAAKIRHFADLIPVIDGDKAIEMSCWSLGCEAELWTQGWSLEAARVMASEILMGGPLDPEIAAVAEAWTRLRGEGVPLEVVEREWVESGRDLAVLGKGLARFDAELVPKGKR